MFLKSFRNYEIWQRSVDLISEVYEVTKLLPANEPFGLSAQMCRTSLAAASRIGQGAVRKSRREFLRALYLAQASLGELYTQVKVCQRLGFLEEKKSAEILGHILRIDQTITTLTEHLKNTEKY